MAVKLFTVPQSALAALAARAFDYPNLESLATSAPDPATLADLAGALGVGRDLLLRVSARRQALPGWLVAPAAARLGVQDGEVRAAAGRVLEPRRVDRTAERAYPPDRLLGEPVYPEPYAATLPVTFG